MESSNPSAITVRFRGVRGSTPAVSPAMSRYGGNTSCLEVRCDGQLLILDAGTGIRSLGEELAANARGKPISANLLISHTHWDHIQGLPFFLPAYSRDNHIRVLGATGTGETLARALKNQMDPIYFPVGLERLEGLGEVEELASDRTQLGVFSLQVFSLNHPGGCAGFRIEAHGASVGYLSDHEPYAGWERSKEPGSRQSALIGFLRDLDLLILDTQYTEAEYPGRVGWGHGCLPESVALAVAAGVKHFALFHHDPSHDDRKIDQMVEVARSLAGAAPLVVQGAAENQTIVLVGPATRMVDQRLAFA